MKIPVQYKLAIARRADSKNLKTDPSPAASMFVRNEPCRWHKASVVFFSISIRNRCELQKNHNAPCKSDANVEKLSIYDAIGEGREAKK